MYGLIGYPLGHSFSENYFNQKFSSEGIKASYVNFEIPSIENFPKVIGANPNLCGLNVTIPYKQQVIPYLDEIDAEAEAIGAVNVIKFIREKGRGLRLKGYNSDIIGFCDSISPLLLPTHKNALVLGNGGAAKAVVKGLEKLGISSTIVSRTKRQGLLTYQELTEVVMARNTVIVNTTPLGMYPKMNACPDIPYQWLTQGHLCYDLLYNPDVTLFMKKSSQAGARVKNGLEMLLLQAFASWNIWNAK